MGLARVDSVLLLDRQQLPLLDSQLVFEDPVDHLNATFLIKVLVRQVRNVASLNRYTEKRRNSVRLVYE